MSVFDRMEKRDAEQGKYSWRDASASSIVSELESPILRAGNARDNY